MPLWSGVTVIQWSKCDKSADVPLPGPSHPGTELASTNPEGKGKIGRAKLRLRNVLEDLMGSVYFLLFSWKNLMGLSGKFDFETSSVCPVDNLRVRAQLPWSKANVHQPAESTTVTCGSNDKMRVARVGGSRLTKQGWVIKSKVMGPYASIGVISLEELFDGDFKWLYPKNVVPFLEGLVFPSVAICLYWTPPSTRTLSG